MKIGIMGGTFDPIHNGHLMLGEYAYRTFHLDEVWYMPNGNPPHKSKNTIESCSNTRAEMVELAISEYDFFKVSLWELQKKGTHYSYQTFEELKQKYPQDEFFFIIGADSLFEIETWGHPERLFPNCVILAACRDDKEPEDVKEQIQFLKQKHAADIRLLKMPMVNISSSEIRQMIKDGEAIASLLPEAVESYIRKHHLYEEE